MAATATLLARALHHDPAYAAVFPDEAKRPARQARFFRSHLANHVPHRCSFVRVSDDGGVVATVTLRPPRGIRVAPTAMLRGLVTLGLTCGPGVIRRLIAVRDAYEELERRASGGQPYWHVHMMAVAPELQGKGLGSRFFGEAMKGSAREAAPIVLTTHKAINVRFYERAGFRVTHEERVAPGGVAPYPVWCMRRDPGA